MHEGGSSTVARNGSRGQQWASARARGFRHVAGTVGLSIASILAGILGALDPGGLRHAFNAGGGARALLAFAVVVTASSLAGGAVASWLVWRLGERSWWRMGGACARETGIDEATTREVLGERTQ